MSRLTSSWQWKDWTIAGLAIALAVVCSLWWWQGPGAGDTETAIEDGVEAVSVFDVVLDRNDRAFVDIFFDRAVGEGSVGEILGRPPATLDPHRAGTWRWRDRQILRFEPNGGFPMASRFELALIEERLLGDGQVFAGDSEFSFETDRFVLESVSIEEEPLPEGGGRVTLRGTLRFNYAVDPEQLAPLLRLRDPAGAASEITVEVQDRYWSRDEIEFVTGEVGKGRAERELELIVGGSLTPEAGNVTLGNDAVHKIPLGSRDRLKVRDVSFTTGVDESHVRLLLTSPVDAQVASKYLRVEPQARYRLKSQRNRLELTGDFEPGRTYTVSLAAGLPAADGATLVEPWGASVTLPDLEPSLDFQSQGTFLAASGHRNVVVESLNVERYRLAIDRAYSSNLFFLFSYSDLLESGSTYPGSGIRSVFGDRIVDESVTVEAERNKTASSVLPIGRYVDSASPGLYRVMISRPDQWQASQRWLLITDLGAVVKQAPGEVLAWVSSVDSLAPVGRARVTLLSDQNQEIAAGWTDERGFWRYRNRQRLDDHRPYLLRIEKDRDFTFVMLDRMGIDTAGLDVGGAAPLGDGYTAFLYGERDLYRPGETVEGLAVVRDERLRASPQMPAVLRHRDPRGLEVGKRTVSIDRRGLATFELELSAWTLTGSHLLELEVGERVIGSYRFQVEEFIPDRIKVEIDTTAETPGPGEELSFEIRSAYLFGPPAATLPVEARVRLAESSFSPPGFENFSFRNGDRQFSDRDLLEIDGVLDSDGRQSFSAPVPSGLQVPSSLQAVITARVSERGGRGVAARTAVDVHPYPYYVGLRRTLDGYAEPGSSVVFEYVAVAPDGETIETAGLEAELYWMRWQTVLRKTPSGGFKYETVRDPVPVASQAIGAGESRGRFEFTPDDYGSHRVVVTDTATGASAAVDFWASGWGYSPWAMENPSRIELDLDKEEYQPGETAIVQVRAPFSGRLLLTVERQEIYSTQVHRLDGNTATVRVPITAAFRPNAYVTATVVRSVSDLDPGGVGRAFGATPLFVDRVANRLEVEIEAAAEVRSESTLEVEARAEPGSVITVAAVDEGILQLVAQETPDPFDFFYRKLALAVRSFDTYSLLLPDVGLEGVADAGGGVGAQGMAQFVRTEGIRRVQPVAFWSGPVEADRNGRARVSFDLPEFQGALRLMAVALNDQRVGSSDRLTRVRDPLVLLPTLPRILAFGDRLLVPVTVRNDSGSMAEIEVGLELGGPARPAGPLSRSITLSNTAEETVFFAIETGDRAGEVELIFTAESAGNRSRATGRVGVRSHLPPVAFERAGEVEGLEVDLPFQSPVGFRAESARRSLRIGALPLMQFAGKLDALVRYPYGCLEQLVSGAFPQIYLADIIQRLDPELLDPAGRGLDPEANVAAALRRVGALQRSDGSFSLWPRWGSHAWTSVYATHFLVEAERAGYPVSSLASDRALSYLDDQVKAKSTYSSTELARAVYALYVLARAGRADLGTMDFLREQHAAALRPESRALLAAAYASLGNRDAVGELLDRLQEIERVERQTGSNFDSTVRNRAVLLLALLDADPESERIPQLVDRLARDAVTSPWWTTQESAFAFLSLGQLFRQQEQRGSYRGEVYLGDRLLGPVTSDAPAVFADLDGRQPLRIVMEPGYEAGAAFFSLMTRGIPTDEDFRPSTSGLEIERRFLDREGVEVDLEAVQQGDLLVMKTRVRSVSGELENVVVQNLLPSGLEVENPRLETTERLAWMEGADQAAAYLDLRDDRILLFADLPANSWQTFYALVRAVSPGSFRLPPAHAEAMYNAALSATGEPGTMTVRTLEE